MLSDERQPSEEPRFETVKTVSAASFHIFQAALSVYMKIVSEDGSQTQYTT